jgi:hypothetical protein
MPIKTTKIGKMAISTSEDVEKLHHFHVASMNIK